MDAVFAVMPFATFNTPAIGVSLLKAEISRRGFESRIRYFVLDFLETVGPDLYTALAGGQLGPRVTMSIPTEMLLGEWFFAGVAFPDRPPDDRAYLDRFVRGSPLQRLLPRILEARRHAADFVERCADQIRRDGPRVVGFTTVFHQTCASLAVARRLKELPDPPLVLFGGGNCAGAMGLQLVRSFPWIDYVCLGEGDQVLPAFLERVRQGDPGPVPGLVTRADLGTSRAPLVRDLDDLPLPDYHEYFDRLKRSPLRRKIQPRLPLETARGCWWGEKHHCTFCGLNTESMAFRSKSGERVLDELAALRATYGVKEIDCVDNIMNMRFLQTLFPKVIERGMKLDLFYEVKANLRYDQLRLLRDAGITSIQAGVESFSDGILRLMRKGCTGAQNIQLLRWCEELGLDVTWNILYGFPDEAPAEYARMTRLIPLLVHLRYPDFVVPIRMDRFSPNFADAERLGLARARPAEAYGHIYPLQGADLAGVAYYFEFEYRDGRSPGDYTRSLRRAVRRWERGSLSADPPRLDLFEADGVALVQDTRPCARQPLHILQGLERELYLAGDVAHGAEHLATSVGAPEPEVTRILRRLVGSRLMVSWEGKYLSLAVFRNRTGAAVRPERRATPAARPA